MKEQAPPSAHEKKLMDLNAMIDAELAKASAAFKGCFGSLFFDAEDAQCKACGDFGACAKAAQENRPTMLADIDAECKTLADQFKPKPKADEIWEEAKNDAERAVAKAHAEMESKPEPYEAEKLADALEAANAKALGEIDHDALVIKNKKRPVDWVAITKALADAQHATTDEFRAAMSEMVLTQAPEMPKGNLYDYARRLLAGLADQGAITTDGKVINWLKA